MRFNLAIVALVAIGCGSTHRDEEMGPQVGGDGDGGSQDGGLLDASPDGLDAGSTPDADSGSDERDAGHEGDSGHPLGDAAVEDDAGDDPGQDASVGMCTGDLTEEPATFGTAEHPIELAASEVTFEGEIDWRGRAFARITGLTPGTRYVITADAAANPVLSAFTDDTTFTEAACISGDQPVERDLLCLVTATGTSIDVAIDAVDVATAFTITIRAAYPSEGTSAAPVQIAASALPYDLEVNSEATNFYEITGLTPSVPYVVSTLAAADVVFLDVYEDGAIAGSATDQQRSSHARAIGTPVGTSLFVAVRAWGPGTTAELDVRPATHAAEGATGAPIQIASSALPFDGEVGWAYNTTPHPIPTTQSGGSVSFYEITGLTPGMYELTLDDATAPVVGLLEDDDYGMLPYSHLPYWVHADENIPARIAMRVTGSTLRVSVQNQGGDGTGFSLDLKPGGRASVGTAGAPIEIPSTTLPFSGEIEPNNYSYYEITGLTPGQSYLARVTNVTEAAVGIFFTDGLRSQPCEIQAQSGTSGLTCTIVPDRTTARVQARVFGYGRTAVVGSVFTLSLEPISEQSLGTPEAAVVVDCPSGTYTSEVGTNGYSYYEITGLEAGVAYLVEATQPGADEALVYVFPGGVERPFYSSPYCMSYGYPARCVSTSAEGSLFVQVIGYLRGQPVELKWRRAAMGSEGTEETPLALGPADFPYAGQVSGASPSFYAISGLVPGMEYVVRVTPVEEQLEVHAYSSVSFENADEVAVGTVVPGEPFVRTLTATDAIGYLRIALPIGTDAIGTYTVEVSLP